MLPYAANHHQPPSGAATTDRLAAVTAAGALAESAGGAAAATGSVPARGGQPLTVDPPQMSSAVAHALAAVLTDGPPLSESAIVLATRAACALESQALAAPPVRSLGRRQLAPPVLAAPASATVARAAAAGPARRQGVRGEEAEPTQGEGGQVSSGTTNSRSSGSGLPKRSGGSSSITGSTLAQAGEQRSLHQGPGSQAAGHEPVASASSSSLPSPSDGPQDVRPGPKNAPVGPRAGSAGADAERLLGVPPLLPRVNAAALHHGTVTSAAAASPHQATSSNPPTADAASEDLAATPTAMESLMASLMEAKPGSRHHQQQHQQHVDEEGRHELVQHVPGPSEQLQMLRAAAHPQLGDQRLLLRLLSLALTQHWAGRAGHRQQRQQQQQRQQHELPSQSDRHLVRRSTKHGKEGQAEQPDKTPHRPGSGERLSWLLRVAGAVLANPRTADEAESAAVRRFRRELQPPGEAAGSADPRITLMRVQVMLDELPGAERLAEAEDEWSSGSDADGDGEEGGGSLIHTAAAADRTHMHPRATAAAASGGGSGGGLREALRDRLKALVAGPSPEVLSLLAVTPAAIGGRATHGGAAMLLDLVARFPSPPAAVQLGRTLASQPPVVAQRGAVRQAAPAGEGPPVVARTGAVRQAVEELLDEIEVELLSETQSGALAPPATAAAAAAASGAAGLAEAGAAAWGETGLGMAFGPVPSDANMEAAAHRRELLMEAVGVAAHLPPGEAMAKRRRSMAGALDRAAAETAAAGLLQPEDQLQLLQLLADGRVLGAPLAQQLVESVSGWLLQGQGQQDAAGGASEGGEHEQAGGQGHVAALARRVEVSERLLALLPKLGMARNPVVVQLDQLYGRQAAANQLQRVVSEVALRAARRGHAAAGSADTSAPATAAPGPSSGSWTGGAAYVGASAIDGTGEGELQLAAPAGAGATQDLLAGLRGRLLNCLVAADIPTRVKTLRVLAELGAIDREVMEAAADRLLSNLSVSLPRFRHLNGNFSAVARCVCGKGNRHTCHTCGRCVETLLELPCLPCRPHIARTHSRAHASCAPATHSTYPPHLSPAPPLCSHPFAMTCRASVAAPH